MDIVDIRANMPNYDVYRGWQRPDSIESILIHHSGAGTVNHEGKPNMLLRNMANQHVQEEGRAHVSYHYAINPTGRVFYLLDEQIAGYHAALPIPASSDQAAMQRWKSDWLNGQYFNRRSISIVLLGWFDTNRRQNGRSIPDNETTTPPDAQWQALVTLVKEIKDRYNIYPARIEGHREALARAGFGQTTCPGLQVDLGRLRAEVSGQAVAQLPNNTTKQSPTESFTQPLVSTPLLSTLPTAPDGSILIPGPAPALTFAKNRALIGLHARNGHTFTNADWQILRQARIESLKMMSFTHDEVYAQARQINPNMEFIVRLYAGSPGRGNMPSPQQFADQFRAIIDGLHQKFGVLKFEIHNEPNHPSGLEGWGTSHSDALAFQTWYKQTLSIFKTRHKWALFGYPGLAIPHNDLEWLDWNREAIEMSDWLGMHCYWQTPPGVENNFMSDFWGQRFKAYHQKHPNKLIEITEFGNSNGQNPSLRLSRQEQRRQYVWWLRNTANFPYIGSAHSFIATSPDPRWQQEGFTWGNANGPFEVASAVGAISRSAARPDWHYSSAVNLPAQLPPDTPLTFPLTIGNSGRLPWLKEGDGRTSLRIQWVDGNNRTVGKATWSRLPHDVAPGGQAELEMSIKTPAEETDYRLQVALYHSGLRKWFHQLNFNQSIAHFATTIVSSTRNLPDDGISDLPDLLASYSILAVPEQGIANANALVEVEVRNDGARRWVTDGEEQGSIRLGYHWINAESKRLEGRGRGSLSHPVSHGESTRIVMPLRYPDEPGSYTLQIGMVAELERWFAQKIDHAIQINPPSALYAVAYQAQHLSTIAVGTQRELTIELHNVGGRSWLARGDAPITVVHQWINQQGHSVQPTLRVLLPRDVPPNDRVTVRLPLLAPGKAGMYQLQIDMAEEGRLFFSQQGNSPLRQQIRVDAAQDVPNWSAQWLLVDAPNVLTVGQNGQINVHLRNVGQQIWSRNEVRLAYRWPNGDVGRVELPIDVLPGNDMALGLPITASTLGEQRLTLDLWHEREGWLQVASEAERINVLPLNRPLTPQSHTPDGTIAALAQDEPSLDEELAALFAETSDLSSNNDTDLQTLTPTDPRLEQPSTEDDPSFAAEKPAPQEDASLLAAEADPSSFGATQTSSVSHGEASHSETSEVLPPIIEQVASLPDVEADPSSFSEDDPSQKIGVNGPQTSEVSHGEASHSETSEVFAPEQVREDDPSLVSSQKIGVNTSQTSEVFETSEVLPPIIEQVPSLLGGTQTSEVSHGEASHLETSEILPHESAESLIDAFLSKAKADSSLPAETTTKAEGPTSPAVPSSDTANLTAIADDLTDDPINYKELTSTSARPPVKHRPKTNTVPPAASTSAHQITATASHHPERAMLALDDHKITGWSSQAPQEPGMWFLLDLGQTQTVRSLRLLSQPEQFPRGYTLEASQDGQTWQTLHNVPENWSDIALELPIPHHLRYLRITQTNHNPWGQPWSVRDVHIGMEQRA